MEETLGKRIAANRRRLGLTQDALAEKLGLTAQAVSKWENDQSCPDITMLPRLAEIFRISTDELLGLENRQVHEGEVVSGEGGHEGGINLEIPVTTGKRTSLSFAVLVLLVGSLLLAGSLLGWELSFWGILWPSALLVFGMSKLICGFSFFRVGCALVGGYCLANELKLIPEALQSGGNLVFPLLVVLLGLSLLSDALRKPEKRHFRIGHKADLSHIGKNHFTKGTDSFSCEVTFGEQHHDVQIPGLKSAEIGVSFGELTVDLTGCEPFAQNCRLDANCSFGELSLYVPKSCRVEPRTSTAFAEFNVRGTPDDDAAYTVYLEGSANFGQIVVKYV